MKEKLEELIVLKQNIKLGGSKMQNVKENFKKDVLSIMCGIIVGCIFIHHIDLQWASWLKWVAGIFGGGLFTYSLRMAFEPARVKNAVNIAWKKTKEIEIRLSKIKWQATREEFVNDLRGAFVALSMICWFSICMTIVTSLQENSSDFKWIMVFYLVTFFHILVLVIVTLKGFAKQEEGVNVSIKTLLKWNFITLPFSLFYYVIIKFAILGLLKVSLKFLVYSAKLIHSSIFTACATYTTVFVLVTAIISSEIWVIFALGFIGGVVGSLMRRAVPKWFHWELPQVAST